MALSLPQYRKRERWRRTVLSGPLLAFSVIAFLSMTVRPGVVSASARSDPEQALSVIAAVPENWPPHYSMTKDGRPTGMAIEMLEAVARLANLKVTYRVVENWEQAIVLLRTGEVDLIPNFGRSSEREQWAGFTRSLDTTRISVFIRRSSQDVNSTDPLSGRAVAVVRSNIAAELLEQRTDLVLMEFDAVETALFALFSGQVDALVYPEKIVLSLARKVGLAEQIRIVGAALTEVKRAIAVRSDRPELLVRIDRAVGAFIGTSAYQEIFARWYQNQKPFWLDEQFLWGLVGALILVLVIAIAWRYVGMLRMNRALVVAGAARENAIEALRESESRYRTLIEGSNLAVQIANREGKRVFVNRAYAELAGYASMEELAGTPSGSFAAPHDRERVVGYRNELFERDNARKSYEFDAVRKDGSIIPVQAFVQRIMWHGEDAIQRTFIDLTDRRRAEASLRESEARYRELIEGSNLPIMIGLRSGLRVLVNRAYARLLGYETPEEVLSHPSGTLVVAEHDRERVRRYRERLFTGADVPTSYEFDAVRKDGRIVPIQAFIQRIQWQGEDAVQRTFIDLTDRRSAEASLRESEARYRDLIQGFPLGIQIFSAGGSRLLANEAFARLAGHDSVEEAVSTPKGTFTLAEDRERMRDLRRRVLRGELQDASDETTLVRKDGSYVPILTITRRIVWRDQPALQRTYVDLTERKKAEAALRASEERFRTVFDAGGAGMILCDMDARYLRVNKAFCDLLGYREDEIVGRTVLDFTHPDDLENTRHGIAEIVQASTTGPRIREKRYLRKDGGTVWVLLCVVVAGDSATGESYAIGIVQNISERKRAEQELADSRRRLLDAQRIARIGDWERDFASGRIYWSDEVHRIFGIEREDFDITFASFIRILVHPDDRRMVEEAVAHCLSTGDAYSLDHRIVRSDGEVRIVHEEGEVVMGPDGEPVRFSGTVQDVTELHQARQALESSEALFRGVFEAGGAGIVLTDEDGRILDSNRLFADFLGSTRDEILGVRIGDIFHPDDAGQARQQRHALFRGEIENFHAERRLLRKDGEVLWVNVSATVMRDAPGTPPTLIGIIRDITQRKASEAALAHKSRFLDLARDLTMAANQAAHFADAVQYCLDRICTFAGWPLGHAFVRSETDPEVLLPMMVWHLDNPERFRPYCEATRTMKLRVGVGVPGLAIETGDVVWRSDIPVDPTRPTARTDAAMEVGLKSGFAAPVMVGSRVVAVFEFYATETVPRDESMVEVIRQAGTELGRVFEREEAETALLRREEQLRQIIDNVPHFIYVKDRNGRYLLANKALARLYNRSIEEIIGQYQMDLYPDKNEAARILAHDRGVIAAGQMVTSSSGRFQMADGTVRSMRVTKMPYTTQHGDVAVLGIDEDITELMQHEEERRRAQRMDALGKMTGGVAHDFNNLLTIILGNLQLLERRLKDDTLRGFATTAERAARRGADVTRRLLAFARSQPLEPQTIDLNHLVRDMTALVARLLGSGIEIETRLAPDLWRTRADPGQVEDALLNLVINARDAMPDGGRLVIETENVDIPSRTRGGRDTAPGSYATVAVVDTGTGMSEEVIARAVEPFFTTKEVGKGSGLGLSMVYGFVRQSGGDVEIESQPGKGSTLRIYLPRIDAVDVAPVIVGDAPAPTGGRETVLLVEDNPDVREFARYVLSGFDYDVLEAKDSESALAVLDEAGKVDLLFSDVVLPGGVSGPALAKKIRERVPGIVVIFTSGNWDAAPDTLDASAFLQKPYTGKDLAALVRSALDSRPR
jgi:PAS domain S-box-containing protein